MNQTIYYDKQRKIAITVETNEEGQLVQKVQCEPCQEWPDGVMWEDFSYDEGRYEYLMSLNDGQELFGGIFDDEENPWTENGDPIYNIDEVANVVKNKITKRGDSVDNVRLQNILYIINRMHIIEFGSRMFYESVTIKPQEGATYSNTQNNQSHFHFIKYSDCQFINKILKQVMALSNELLIKYVLNDRPYRELPKYKNGGVFVSSDQMVCIFAPWKRIRR